MKEQSDGLPECGPTARQLGVRVGIDVDLDVRSRVGGDVLEDCILAELDDLWSRMSEEEHFELNQLSWGGSEQNEVRTFSDDRKWIDLDKAA